MKKIIGVIVRVYLVTIPVATLPMFQPGDEELTAEDLIARWRLTNDDDKQFTQSYPLHMAAKQDDFPATRRLLQQSRDPNEQTKQLEGAKYAQCNGRTPLHFAALNASPPLVSLLLENNASVEIEEATRKATPLHFALMSPPMPPEAKVKKVSLLVLHAKNPSEYVNGQDKNGRTPLHYVAMTSQNATTEELIRFLLNHGADPSCQNDERKTPYEVAEETNNSLFTEYFPGVEDCLLREARTTQDPGRIEILFSRSHARSIDKRGNSLLHFLYSSKLDSNVSTELKRFMKTIPSIALPYQTMAHLYLKTTYLLLQDLPTDEKNRRGETVESLARKNKLSIILEMAKVRREPPSHCIICEKEFQQADIVIISMLGNMMHEDTCATQWFLAQRGPKSPRMRRLTATRKSISDQSLPQGSQEDTSVTHERKTKSHDTLPPGVQEFGTGLAPEPQGPEQRLTRSKKIRSAPSLPHTSIAEGSAPLSPATQRLLAGSHQKSKDPVRLERKKKVKSAHSLPSEERQSKKPTRVAHPKKSKSASSLPEMPKDL